MYRVPTSTRTYPKIENLICTDAAYRLVRSLYLARGSKPLAIRFRKPTKGAIIALF